MPCCVESLSDYAFNHVTGGGLLFLHKVLVVASNYRPDIRPYILLQPGPSSTIRLRSDSKTEYPVHPYYPYKVKHNLSIGAKMYGLE